MAKRGRKKKKKLFRFLKLKPNTVKTIFFIFFLFLTIIAIVSFLQIGIFPTKLNSFLIAYFGFSAVFIPFLLLFISFLFFNGKFVLKDPNIFFGFMIMFISFISLTQAGIVGNFIKEQIINLFGEFLSTVIFIFSFIVGFVILFDTNIYQIIKFFNNLFKVIKKYTIGNSFSKKTKQKKINSLFDVKPSPQPTKEEKNDITVANIPPVFKEPISTKSSFPDSLNSPSNKIWQYPPISILDNKPGARANRGDVGKNAQIIEETLESFGITAKVREINESPSVTQYALEVALGTKLAKIIGLGNNLAMSLAAPGGQIRVEAPIPGRSLVGIEVPNHSLQVVPIKSVLDSDILKQSKSKITVPLGLDVAGKLKIADIAKMPHVLIAGQTNSGKSVCVNSWISTILFRASPQEVRFIMVDPKRVELTPYNDIPHLLTPVITEANKVVSALKWAVGEMEKRYKIFTGAGAKNIESYNNLSGFQSLPYIIIIIDELAEIIMFSPTEVEENICRLAQMARAVGIHLVLATQKPIVSVVTGLIKGNIPTRVAFAVSSMIDSRVILDTPGAEKLLGRGDMLFLPPELAKPIRIQGCFISEKETVALVDFLKKQKSPEHEYNPEIVSQPIASHTSQSKNMVSVDGEERDARFDEAVDVISQTGKASSTFLQRRLKLGYARAARVIDQLEKAGIVGHSKGAKPRDILIPHNQAEK
jgi:S-DNA-T family DNA segregation ATPase FtsK/SpoIIIE